MLKSAFAILLVSVMLLESLLPAMEISELSKLPDLFEHYQEHRKENPEIGLLDFMELHYANTSHHNLDHKTHDRLPLDNNHNHHQHSVINCIAFTFSNLSIDFSLVPLRDITLVDYSAPATSSFSINIWQPPKKA